MTGQFEHVEQVEQVERRLRQMYADAASAPTEIGGATAADVIGRGRARRRRTRMIAAGVAAAVAVLAAASISVVPTLVDRSLQPTWKPIRGDGRVPNDQVGVWVDSLPSGPVAQAAWVVGDVLHVAAHTARITGPGITASSPITLHAATEGGWLASVGSYPRPVRYGVIHPDGTFVEFQKYGKPVPLLVSPDGSQALVGADGNGDLIDTATGRIIGHEPAIDAFAWGNDGIYAVANSRGQRPVLWKPGIGITKSPFDARHCHQSANQTTASVAAGYSGCTIPQLVSVSPDGTKALAGKHVLDLATGRTIKFAPTDPFVMGVEDGGSEGGDRSVAVVWEDDQHVLIELGTPTIPAGAGVAPTDQNLNFSKNVIVRCNLLNGSCERASDPITSDIAPLH